MVKLYDQFNRPIDTGKLREQQTSRFAGLRQSFAGHPSRGLSPSRLSSILAGAERGDMTGQLDLFEDMEEKDAHIHSEMRKRRYALLGLEWEVMAPRNASAAEKKAAAQVREMLLDVELEDVIYELSDAIGKGFSCLELEWELLGGNDWFPRGIHPRPQRWFAIPDPNTEELRLRDDTATGEALQPFGWVIHTHKAKSGYVSRAALHRVLAWPYLFKIYSVRDLAEFVEIYGLPIRVGTYGTGATEEEKATLLNAVVNVAHDSAAIMPEGMKLDFKEAAKGASDPYMAMIDWCERSESKAIVGQTLTAQADRGSNTNALGSVHDKVREEIVSADAKQIASAITRHLIYPLVALNQGITDPRRAPRFAFDTSDEGDLAMFAENLPKLVDIGMRIPKRYAHEKLKIPEPGEDEEVLQRQGAVSPPASAPRAKATAKLAEQPSEIHGLREQTDRLDREAGPGIDAWLERLLKLLDEVDSLEEFRDRMLEVAPELSPDEVARVMGEALTAAHLAGRYEILDD